MTKTFFTGLRFFLALIFLATSVGKLLDNRGFAEVLHTYQLFPSVILMPLALTISLSEFTLGIFILINKRIILCSRIVLMINSLYLVLAILTNLRGLKIPNCGCFGVFLARPMTWGTVIEDSLLVHASLIFLLHCSNTYSSNRHTRNSH